MHDFSNMSTGTFLCHKSALRSLVGHVCETVGYTVCRKAYS